ncbi:GNAT family N-acetyltransferase [Marinobacter caseinilyticus]|uniref:GNAT family N-acetyltransferase n=1 Tax=Marinobacter caseinilyticus TaxID=2692195 RepID=UPI001409A9B6|nr:GNAT family N-acetyltransferase [Marinobacter caseinilyticus]
MVKPDTCALTVRAATSILDIPEAVWDGFSGSTNPFLRHRFFVALETSGCTTAATGWSPSHLMFYLGDTLIGVAPAYLKTHSMGEYVFDWAWADAYQRYGVDYYPKLLVAVPFTPSVGARLLLSADARDQLTPDPLHRALEVCATELGAHSWHLLFPNSDDQALLTMPGVLQRLGCQFHWFNHGYACFDDFLATLTSRKRKSIRKERRQVSEQGIEFVAFPGETLPDHVLSAFYVFYQATYLKRGQRPYLNLAFFRALQTHQPEQVHVVMAVKDGEMIAGALFLKGQETLYGRYWGCLEEYNHLHFETCYYQGIELAIQQGFQCFDAGAQGEHKLVRGFEPVLTHSYHWVEHPGFRDAITRFTDEEASEVRAYQAAALEALPYRQGA